MEVSIIKIGNSKGFRLSKALLVRYHIKDKVELVLEKNQIVIKPVNKPREGWDELFKEMHQNGDDSMLVSDVFEDEIPEDWK